MTSQLDEIESIKQLKYRYFRLVDTANWTELADCFVESATVSYIGGSYRVERAGRAAILEYLSSAIHAAVHLGAPGRSSRDPADLADERHGHVVSERLVPRPAQQYETLWRVSLRGPLRQGRRRLEDRAHRLRAAIRNSRATPGRAHGHGALPRTSRAPAEHLTQLADARHLVARRRSARVSRGPVTTIEGRCRAPKGAPHIVSARTASSAVSRNRRGVMTSECPRRLPAGARACSRPTRHPVQTPARRGHGGVASRRVDAVVSQPRSTPPSPQLDVAGTLGEGLPRRFRDTATDPALADSTCGAPSGALHRPSIVVSGWRYTAAARRRAHRGRVSASSQLRFSTST